MSKKWFGADYEDYFIEHRSYMNVCGTRIEERYRLKYAKYFLGFKRYVYFELETTGWGDSYSYIVSCKTREELINEYLRMATSEVTAKEHIDICNIEK